MGEVSTIGLDIAKSVFQVHRVDGAGAVVCASASVARRSSSSWWLATVLGRDRILLSRAIAALGGDDAAIGTRSAQSIRASGAFAASTGRTRDRTRPNAAATSESSCQGAVHT